MFYTPEFRKICFSGQLASILDIACDTCTAALSLWAVGTLRYNVHKSNVKPLANSDQAYRLAGDPVIDQTEEM